MYYNDFTFSSRLKHAWNAFLNRAPTTVYRDLGASSSYRLDRPRYHYGNERSIVTSIYNRISLDVSTIDIFDCKTDDNNRFTETNDTHLNSCLTLESNIDQTGRAFRQDIVMSMLDEGAVAIVPTDTTLDPENGAYDILSMRTGKIVAWYPKHVKVELYNENTGQKQQIVVPKASTAIVENPFYSVMNERNSTMQRLIRKLNILDAIDEQSGSGKLDLIIQLPYIIKSQARRNQAEQRRKDIETQLAGSKYGIAYTDGTERITQLNRPVENNLLTQIKYLTELLFSQLGITQAILDGSASPEEMLNYYNRVVEPILSAITDEMKRKFLTKTARTQKRTIMFFRDPFKLVPVSQLAEIADKMTRNEIMTSNEIRQIAGMRPSDDPSADELRNKNLSQPSGSSNPNESKENEDEEPALENE